MNTIEYNIFHSFLNNSLVKKILAQIALFKTHIFLDCSENFFLKNFKSDLGEVGQKPTLTVAIQMPEDYFYVVLFSVMIKILKLKYSLEIKWINVNCEYQRSGKAGFLKRNSLFERKWSRLYLSNGGKVSLSNIFYEKDLKADLVRQAHDLFQGLKSQEDLLDLKYKGIVLGDLIYDTYLRFKPSPTVNLDDPFLERLIVAALHIFESADQFVALNKCNYLFTSYCSYIQHGVLTRVALEHGVKVVSFGSYDQVAKNVSKSFPSHFKDYFEYKNIFEAIDEDKKRELKQFSEKNLNARFSGEVDASTYYMKKSAFGGDSVLIDENKHLFKNTNRKRAVIFLHCFYDSPHIFRYMLYPDFHEWIVRTLEVASEANFDFYVKPHPNAIEGNDVIVNELKIKFPKVVFLPVEASNSQLIKEGFDAAFTVYGTLGHEYPYFGIPVVNAGDNPHINYSFSIHAESREKYEYYVRNLDKIPSVHQNSKDEILEFYYMHNYHMFPGKISVEENRTFNDELRSINSSEKLRLFTEKWQNDKYRIHIESLIKKSLADVL